MVNYARYKNIIETYARQSNATKNVIAYGARGKAGYSRVSHAVVVRLLTTHLREGGAAARARGEISTLPDFLYFSL